MGKVKVGNTLFDLIRAYKTTEASNPVVGRSPDQVEVYIRNNAVNFDTAVDALALAGRVIAMQQAQIQLLEEAVKQLLDAS